jgi:hypothetical protein
MNNIFSSYNLGIRVITVKLQNIVPPKGDVQNAFEDVNRAVQDMPGHEPFSLPRVPSMWSRKASKRSSPALGKRCPLILPGCGVLRVLAIDRVLQTGTAQFNKTLSTSMDYFKYLYNPGGQ